MAMKFGDRISGRTLHEAQQRERRYLEHLVAKGFDTDGDLFRYFGWGEVFHDSEIKIRSLSDDGSLVLQMRNIFAINHFDHNIRPGQGSRRLLKKLFSTSITFGEISRFLWQPLEPPDYYCSELDRLADGKLRLDIFCPTPRGIRRTMRIECARIEVEDIMPRIKSMLPKQEFAKIALWPEYKDSPTKSRGKNP